MYRQLAVRSRLVRQFQGKAGNAGPNPNGQDRPTSHNNTRSKSENSLNVQSDAVEKGQSERKEKVDKSGEKEKPEDSTRAPGPVIGMQDERG